jgi:hypothetical protein
VPSPQPTGAKDIEITICGSYTVKWTPMFGVPKFAAIEVIDGSDTRVSWWKKLLSHYLKRKPAAYTFDIIDWSN